MSKSSRTALVPRFTTSTTEILRNRVVIVLAFVVVAELVDDDSASSTGCAPSGWPVFCGGSGPAFKPTS